ncbi:MAG TPA: TIGR03790 family protein [Verrucomicrobiae bacterium]|nr:TIGR03790 family protein [Verrucomicrobiae bacterium]
MLLLLVALGRPGSARAAGGGDEVIVLYNTRVSESKQVAEYYAQRRAVPPNQVLGLDLPADESMSRQEFLEKLQAPLLKHLEAEKLFTYGPATNRVPNSRPSDPPVRRVIGARVRYAVLCYGVPVKILADPKLVEEGADKLPAELQRNQAAVDSQLACSASSEGRLPWTGPISNPFYAATNAAVLHPTNGLLLVARLDGPSAAIARGLVDKAIDAETNGLWGRAYIDSRGLTNGGYRLGDDWMRASALVARKSGFETVLDEKEATFPAGYPMSQVALYLGWYDQQVSGPFTNGLVEFMPGAFAYHLYSFSAQRLRSTNNSWTGVLLQLGAACTMGAVDEPYLTGTPDLFMFLSRFVSLGFTFGEASYAGLSSVSWQMTIVGDPLYRPFGQSLEELHNKLVKRGSPLADWSHLLVVNRNLEMGYGMANMIDYIYKTAQRARSAVLTEKVGDLYWSQGKMFDALDSYEGALKRGPSPMQRLRLLLNLADRRTLYGPDDVALAWHETLLKEFPDYPDRQRLVRQMLPLAKRLGQTNVIERCEKELLRLSPTVANGTKGK